MTKLEIDSYPLAWPEGWGRTPPYDRRNSNYKVSFVKARDDLVRELRLLAPRSSYIVISTDVPTRRDGLPYATFSEPSDPGVAAFWMDHH